VAEQPVDAAIAALVAASRRSAVGRRLQGDIETRLLQSIVDATARLFDAEAASIALFEPDPDRLEFRVAAGEKGAGAIGLAVPPTQGIVGYVYSTGQPLALSDVGNDPRFNRDAAEQTGYVPRSIAAAPLFDEHGTLGVLQVLDKRSSPTFSLRDMELLGVFARAETRVESLRLAPGESLVCFTDGVTERREGTRMLGEDGVVTVLTGAAAMSAGRLARRLETAVSAFTQAPARDDVAILVLRADPAGEPVRPRPPAG